MGSAELIESTMLVWHNPKGHVDMGSVVRPSEFQI